MAFFLENFQLVSKKVKPGHSKERMHQGKHDYGEFENSGRSVNGGHTEDLTTNIT
jgi:hypothetical protein